MNNDKDMSDELKHNEGLSNGVESKIIVHEKAFIPWYKEFPVEETKAWGEAVRDSIQKSIKGTLKAVPDMKAFRKKIGAPSIANINKMLRDDFVSKKGLTKKTILALMKSKLYGKKSARTYRKNVRGALKTFDQGDLNSAMIGYHLGQCFGEYRVRDAIELALTCLATPLIIQPGKEATFILELHNQLISSVLLISDLAYHPEYTKLENDKRNALINQYISKDIVPFTTGGESHCDFRVIKDSITLFYSAKPKEIKYNTYKEFISEKNANYVRSRWPVIDESIRPDPDEYIGHPEKLAYFDMELDIQVSRK